MPGLKLKKGALSAVKKVAGISRMKKKMAGSAMTGVEQKRMARRMPRSR